MNQSPTNLCAAIEGSSEAGCLDLARNAIFQMFKLPNSVPLRTNLDAVDLDGRAISFHDMKSMSDFFEGDENACDKQETSRRG